MSIEINSFIPEFNIITSGQHKTFDKIISSTNHPLYKQAMKVYRENNILKVLLLMDNSNKLSCKYVNLKIEYNIMQFLKKFKYRIIIFGILYEIYS